MATASTLSYGTVVGQFLVSASDSADADTLPDAVPASGTVTFTPSAGVVLDYSTTPNPSAILKKPIVCTLDAQGYIVGPAGTRGVKLIATDDPNTKPVGWTWVASYALKDDEGNDLRSLVTKPFLVPAGVTTDLVVAMPIEESNGVFLSKGDKGDLTTLEIGSVTVGQPAVSVTEVGPVSELSFVLPVNNLTIGTVTTSTSTPGIVGPQGPTGPKGDPGGISVAAELGNSNLDTFVVPGVYRQTNGAYTTLANNYPINGGIGVLTVLSSQPDNSRFEQTWDPISTNVEGQGRVFFRRVNYAGTWYSWKAYNSTRVDQTAGRAIYQWDNLNNREQLIYGDTGWRNLDTDQAWIDSVTGTGVTLGATDNTGGYIRVRRIGYEVHFKWTVKKSASGTINATAPMPLGWRPSTNSAGLSIVTTNSSLELVRAYIPGGGSANSYNGNAMIGGLATLNVVYLTEDAWPTTLPGTALGGIPNL